MKLAHLSKLIVAIAVCEFAGIIGAAFTMPAVDGWYSTLLKPEIAPPNEVFTPVWTTLFALMGIAAFFVWRKGRERKDVRLALGFFIAQLALNTLWSIIFFGMHSPAVAFMEIIILWFAILATIAAFAKISKLAAWLLVPYILWVSFAAYLNYSIWILNA